jgi:hypothetical protein
MRRQRGLLTAICAQSACQGWAVNTPGLAVEPSRLVSSKVAGGRVEGDAHQLAAAGMPVHRFSCAADCRRH